MLLLLTLGCVAPAAPIDPQPSVPLDTAEPESESAQDDGPLELEVPPAELTATEVASAISTLGSAGLPSPVEVQEVYLWRLDGRSGDCPQGSEANVTTPFGGCVAADGWIWSGIAEYAGEPPESPETPKSFALLGDLEVTSPEGDRLVLGGQISLELDADSDTWATDYAGTWSWSLADGWLGLAGASAVYSAAGSRQDGTTTLTLDGSFHDGSLSVRLDEVVVSSAVCGGEPVGRFELRDASGYWYVLDGQDCGCGPVGWADGTTLGEACVSLAAPLADLAQAMAGGL